MSIAGAHPLFSTRTHGDVVVVALRGEIDIVTAPDIEFHLDHLTRVRRTHLFIDLKAVTFIGACGIALLVRARERVLAGAGTLSLICVSPFVLRLLSLPGLCRPRFVVLARSPVPAP
ncbi:anti-sigma factor antagonist (plasmid) [Embleya sp. NBC_00888]|uniref:anti-sigma factor antagonist n=1 Tax=Embleya sp. NBC_00888 TaxID=2975960 RepID=UPI002F915ED4|nr:anti-sigma factor antagonist [Embleya sp. NBC_00888]